MSDARSRTQWELAWRQLKKNRLAMLGGATLLALYFLMFTSGFLAPYAEDFSDRSRGYMPPSAIRFRDAEGRWRLRPFIYDYKSELVPGRFTLDPKRPYPILFFVKGLDGRLHLFGVEEPARIYLFGGDQLGRDLFTRVLYGSRTALTIGFVGIAISYSLGLLLGGISGYYGGWVDNLLQRIGELLMTFPQFYLLLALRAIIPDDPRKWVGEKLAWIPGDLLKLLQGMAPQKLESAHVYLMIVLILSVIRWPGVARIVRGMVLSLREREFVTAARAIGASPLRIIVRHILPNTLSQVIVLVTLSIPGFILGEAALSFLDLGIREPQASWGNMLAAAQDLTALTHYPWILSPGVFIIVTVVAFNFVGDGLRDALDPKMRV